MAKLAWTPPEGNGVEGYIVRFRDMADPGVFFFYNTESTVLVDAEKALNLAPGHTYGFSVAAWNPYGQGPYNQEVVWEYKAPYEPPSDSLPEKKDYFVITLPPGMLTQL